MTIASVNPATGEVLETFEALTPGKLEDRLARAAGAAASYRLTSFEERAAWLARAAAILDDEVERVARMVTTEMGKPVGAARAEVAKCATGCRFYAARAAGYLADEPVEAAAVGARRAFARYEPLGPVLAVMPWNFPLWQVVRFAAPALMAGNVGLLKHAPNVPRTAVYLEDLFRRAGFPEGALQALLVEVDQVEEVLRDPRVRAATLTGSTRAGRAVASLAGSVLKPSVLELGGTDAFVVMPSADLPAAVATAVTARCQNNGQSCIAAKRFIVHRDVAGEFRDRFVAAMAALRVGDPMDEGTDVGPLVSEQARATVEAQVDDAAGHGATVRCGGRRPDGPGWYYPPTVVEGISPEMRMWAEEVFGPVAGLYTVDGVDEAVALANATDYGLGSNAWTDDPGEQARFVRDLEAGAVFVNGMTASYPELPFGGVKQSGYGRELSAHGIRAFCNVKTVWIGGRPEEEGPAEPVE
ncbi:MAG TPA: NADP-dependent succinic semialdehyde dehydrogenase [Acidimicrobiales bacterium]|nr:NADP-dependent succinic semialdehyde dehydrogenase [Acidimicrobiales bacterium]